MKFNEKNVIEFKIILFVFDTFHDRVYNEDDYRIHTFQFLNHMMAICKIDQVSYQIYDTIGVFFLLAVEQSRGGILVEFEQVFWKFNPGWVKVFDSVWDLYASSDIDRVASIGIEWVVG